MTADADGLILARPSFPVARIAAGTPLAALVERLGGGIVDAPPLRPALNALAALGLVAATIVDAGSVVARLEPVAPGGMALASAPAALPALDPMLVLRPIPNGLRATVAGGALRLDLLSLPAIAALTGMAVAPGGMLADQPPLAGLVAHFLAAMGAFAADEAYAGWDPVDLEFHHRTRRADLTIPYGPAPDPDPDALPPRPMLGAPLALPRPDIAALRGGDRPFAQVVEDRSANHLIAARALGQAELGTLLFRTMRARASGTGHGRRPYPSGGRCYELDLYLAVRAVEGVAAGLYRYDPDAHVIQSVVSGEPSATAALLGHAAATIAGQPEPPVLLILAADFGRVQRRYRGMPYALILKHVGVVMQALALAGEADGLVVRPLGGGQARLFASATGIDPLEMGSVGELAVFAKSG